MHYYNTEKLFLGGLLYIIVKDSILGLVLVSGVRIIICSGCGLRTGGKSIGAYIVGKSLRHIVVNNIGILPHLV